MKGITSYYMVIFYGTVVHDGTTKGNVNYGPSRIDMIWNKQYIARGIPGVAAGGTAKSQIYFGNVQPTVATGITVDEFSPTGTVTATSN